VASATETTIVTRELQIDASPETVWDFLVDPVLMTRWMGEVAELDPQPGGMYRVRVLPGNVARGEFVALDPPRRLVLTWGWEEMRPGSSVEPGTLPPGASTVEFDLEPNGGGTLLRFTHRDLPSTEAAASHGEGWDHYLGRLTTAASGGDPGRDNWLEEMS
jgi:uncharacterized protein YndB with AHSA1/START domain